MKIYLLKIDNRDDRCERKLFSHTKLNQLILLRNSAYLLNDVLFLKNE